MTQHAVENERDRGSDKLRYLDKIVSRKMQEAMRREIASICDSLEAWIAHYLQYAVLGVCSTGMAVNVGSRIVLISRGHALRRHPRHL